MKWTTRIKVNWLRKRQLKLRQKVDMAFLRVKRELVLFVNEFKGKPTPFVKYLSQVLQTNDVMSFIKILDGIISDAKLCKGDIEAKKAIMLCKYIKLRIHILSNFTLKWTNIKIHCNNCGQVTETNFLYTDKLCTYCGNILFN